MPQSDQDRVDLTDSNYRRSKLRAQAVESQAPEPASDRANILLPDSHIASSSAPQECHEQTYLTGQLWQPLWLQPTVLLAFLCIYASLVVATLGIYYLSLKNDGFLVSESVSHYAWTYGPTAVLVFAVGLWRQVDYHCKQIAPWSQMYTGPTTARLSVLMDYLSPFQIFSFAQAARDRHYSVVASILGFGLLKLITVASTGFLVLRTSSVTESAFPLIATTKFDESNFDIHSVYSNPNPDALYTYYANIMQGLPLASGVTAQSAYSTFEPARGNKANATITTVVDVFRPGYNCEIVDSQVGEFHSSNSTLDINLTSSPSCQQWDSFAVKMAHATQAALPERIVLESWSYTRCNDASSQTSTSDTSLMVYAILDIHYERTPFFDEFTGQTYYPNSKFNVTKLTTVACRASPQIVKAKISNDTTAPQRVTLSFLNSEVAYLSTRFNGSMMVSTVMTLLSSSHNFLNSSDVSGPGQVLFHLMALSQNSSSVDYSGLLDAQALRTSAEAVFNGITSQWVHLNLMVQTQDNITGEVIYTVDSLHVAQVSLWIMVAGFALLMLVTIVVWSSPATRVVSRDPGNIAAVATILSRSNRLNSLLCSIHADSETSLEHRLSSQCFTTSATENQGVSVFRINVSPADAGCNDHKWKEMPHVQSPTWRPVTLSLPIIMATFILPIAVIVVLQILQNLSDRSEGMFDVAKESEKYHQYIPVLVMLLTATLFNSLDFNIVTLSAYSSLHQNANSGSHFLCSNLLGKVAPYALFSAIREGHFGVVMSAIASSIGSVLTIVVSALYIVQDTHAPTASQHLERLGTFDLTWNNSISNDNHAALTLSLVRNLNLSYPSFTHSEVALPKFRLGEWIESPKTDSTIAGSSHAMLPALRANLNCTMVPKSRLKMWTDPGGVYLNDTDLQRRIYVNVSVNLPEDCQQNIMGYQPALSTFTHSFGIPTTDRMYAGAQANLAYGPVPGFAGNWEENPYMYPNPAEIRDNPTSCPSLAFILGRFEWSSINSSSVTAMFCFQEIQTVQVAISLLPNSTQLDMSQSPAVNGSSAKTLLNGNSGSTAFQYRIQDHLANALFAPRRGQLDGFFHAMVNGSTPVMLESLIGSSNEQRLFDTINHFYRMYMAQAISANMRVPCSDLTGSCDRIIGSAAVDINQQSAMTDNKLGNLTVYTATPRLRQDKTTKTILQAMLAVMTICGMLAFWSTKMRNLLPYNPCSIAGTMGLLAGSELCGGHARETDASPGHSHNSQHETLHDRRLRPLIPDGAEWMNDHDLKAVFAGHRYSLRWWKFGNRSNIHVDVGHGAGVSTGVDWHADRRDRYGIDVVSVPDHRTSSSQTPSPRYVDNTKHWGIPGIIWRRVRQRPSLLSLHRQDERRS